PYLAVTLDEEYPRLQVMRGAKRKGVRYFGPYSHAWAIRETLDLLLRVFPARTCSAGVFKRSGQIGRPCLLGYIGKCSAPCVGRVSADEHRQIVEEFVEFMAGRTDRMERGLERQMQAAPAELEFERAARLPADADALTEWLSERRGSRVALRVPQRGDKKALMETVARNAGQALAQHKLKRAGDLTTRSKALEEIADALGMGQAPLRIECYDVSQIQGTDVVASMVVFEDGLARKSEYRRFAVRGASDDLSALSEVLGRRFARYLEALAQLGDDGPIDPTELRCAAPAVA